MVDAFFCITDEGSKNALELHGSLGSILAEGTIGQGAKGKMTAILKAGAGGYDAQQSRDAPGGIEIAPEPVNPYRAEIEEFSQAILDNRAPAVDARIGVRSQRVLSACYESARRGRGGRGGGGEEGTKDKQSTPTPRPVGGRAGPRSNCRLSPPPPKKNTPPRATLFAARAF